MTFQPIVGGGAKDPLADLLSLDERQLEARLTQLRQEHRDLDAAIAAMAGAQPDGFTLARLKKRKLLLKDLIARVEDALTPDIIA